VDWPRVERALDAEGHALLPGFFAHAQVRALVLASPWPDFLAQAGVALRRGLAPVVRRWRERLGDAQGPGEHEPGGGDRFAGAQLQRLRAGEWQPLRALDTGAAGACPFALVALLSEPGRDFAGGELVLTERRPRMQSRPIVLPLRRGDAAIVATGSRPCRGASGWYRTSLRQAIGRVREGERVGLFLPLDDEIRGQV
jgi:hypothetical protein